MARRKFIWTPKQIDKLNKVKTVLDEMECYKPLTLRQVYYQLVGKGHIQNNISEYGMLSKLVKHARLDGEIPWDDIEDRVRAIDFGEGWLNKTNFVAHEEQIFLEGYKRHLVQDQDKFIEIWVEKDALKTIFTKIANPYCISTVICRGFSSVSFVKDFADRVLQAQQEGKRPIMLYFGDFDPSGMAMMTAMQETLEKEMGVSGVEFRRVGLLLSDIERYSLPHDPSALKKKDTRAGKFVKSFGNLAVELDALHPKILEEKIRQAIENELDLEKLEKQKAIYDLELQDINELKDKVSLFVMNN